MSHDNQDDRPVWPGTALSPCALRLRDWGMTSYKVTVVLAALWLLMIVVSALYSSGQSLFDRILGVVILGGLPSAIAYLLAWVIRIGFAALSRVYDPIETMLLVLAELCLALFCLIRTSMRDGWHGAMSEGPRLRHPWTVTREILRRTGSAAFRLATMPIRMSARLLLSMSLPRMHEIPAR